MFEQSEMESPVFSEGQCKGATYKLHISEISGVLVCWLPLVLLG